MIAFLVFFPMIAAICSYCIGRKDKVIIPTGDDVISNGDTVIVVTAKHHPEGLGDILES